MNTGGLVAPADVQTIDEGGIARSIHGAQSSAPTWAVGDPVATALSGLSGMVDKYAKAYDDVVVNDYTMQKSKELDDLYNNPDTGIFNTRKGDAAKGAYQDYKSVIRDMWDHDAMDKLTERQRDMASKHLYTLFSSYGHRVAEFETKELMGAQVDRCKNAMQNAIDIMSTGHATVDDIANVYNAIQTSTRQMGVMQGWNEETIDRVQREAMSDGLTKASAAIAVTDPIAALGLLNTYKDLMLPAAYAGAVQALDGKLNSVYQEEYIRRREEGDEEGAQRWLNEHSAVNVGGGIINTRGKKGSIADDQNNPWNLSKRGSSDATPQRQRFEHFNTPEEGTFAAYKQFVRYNQGKLGKTVTGPNAEGKTAAIPMNTLRGMVYKWQSGKRDNPAKVVAAMAKTGLPMDTPFDATSPTGKQMIASMMSQLAVNESSWRISPQQIMQVIGSGGTAGGVAGGSNGGGEYRPVPGAIKPSQVEALKYRTDMRINQNKVNAAKEVLLGMDRHEAREKLSTIEGQQSLGLNPEQAASVMRTLIPYWNMAAREDVNKGVKEVVDTVRDMRMDRREANAMSLLEKRFPDEEERSLAYAEYIKRMKKEDQMRITAAWEQISPEIKEGLKNGMTKQEIWSMIYNNPRYSDFAKLAVQKGLVESVKDNTESQAWKANLKVAANAQLQNGEDPEKVKKDMQALAFGNLTKSQTEDLMKYIDNGGNVAGVTLERCDKIYRRRLAAKGVNSKDMHLEERAYALILDNLDPNEEKYTDDKLAKIIADFLITEYKKRGSVWNSSTTIYDAFKNGDEELLMEVNPDKLRAAEEEFKRRNIVYTSDSPGLAAFKSKKVNFKGVNTANAPR